jgi:hypothetical protein
MLEATVAIDTTTAPVSHTPTQAKLDAREPRHLEMKWITTEYGLEASWVVHPIHPAHFVLWNGRIMLAE